MSLAILTMKYQFGLILAVAFICSIDGAKRKFPDNFQFGAATSAYQVEGGWDENGKGESMWDRLAHTTDLIAGGHSGDVVCDSYHQYRRDVEMLASLGVDYYRFSLSWTRILPTGFADKINPDGIRYYNALIDELISNGITPAITLYHWDLPQSIAELGGWTNPETAQYFVDFAEVVFDAFGDRVKHWLTLNEPMICCWLGYGITGMAPAANMSGIGDYLCGRTMLMGHAMVYRLYDEKYRPTQKGRVGLTMNSNWIEPSDRSPEGLQAGEDAMHFELGWFANPIYSSEGDYPKIMKENIAKKSMEQGFKHTRLPNFTPEEVKYIQGTADFFGLNHYSTYMGRKQVSQDTTRVPSYEDDRGVIFFQNETWPGGASQWVKVVPWGFTNILNWIKKTYNNPEVMIFENGYSDRGGLKDKERIKYFHLYLNAMLDAIEQGVNVTAYTAWSLMDNIEWLAGFEEHFGLFQVDFNSPYRTRTPKESASFYKEIIKSKMIDSDLNTY